MKKALVCLLFVFCLFLGLIGCGPSPAPSTEPPRTEAPASSAPITTAAPVITTEAPAITTAALPSETNGEPAFDVSDVNGYLDDFLPGVQELVPGSTFSYSWYKGNLFIEILIPEYDFFLENKADLTDEVRGSVRAISHGYVVGEFAETVYNNIRSLGGDDFNVYFTLCGEKNTLCASCNLRLISDPLNE